MADEDDSKNKPGDKEGQGDTGDKAGQKGEGDQDDDQGEIKFSPKQQEHINSILAEERRKEAKKAEKGRMPEKKTVTVSSFSSLFNCLPKSQKFCKND